MPNVVSRIIVAKYQMHGSLSNLTDSFNEMATFKKCAKNCDTACFDVSMIHIFQGLFGCYLYRLKKRTANERIPKNNCTTTPTNPKILHWGYYYIISI